MRMIPSRLAVVYASWLLACPAEAKRKEPALVPPVVSGDVRYSVEGNGRAQSVVATAIGSGAVLWTVRVFRNKIRKGLEEDVQWVFINELKVAGRTLLIRDEKSRCYVLDLATRRVKPQPCAE